MLLSLHVKNLALIDETEVFFGEGLNILTGETGAGKSIIIGSVNLALGARADKDMIRTGAEYALIELVFQVTDAGQRQMITQMEVPLEEDGTLLIQRKISATRNLCKIGGENATTKTVREVAELLMDIHGQHEHQSLFHIKKHMELLDDYAKTDLSAVKNRIQEQYGIYKELKEESEQTNLDQAEQSRQLSLAQFEWEEIDNAGLVIGEDEILETKYHKLIHGKRIIEACSAINGYMNTDEEAGNESAGELIGRASKELNTVLAYDDALIPMEESLHTIEDLVHDFNRSVTDYMSELQYDAQIWTETEERLDLLNRLKSKYGNQIEEILLYKKKQEDAITRLQDYEAYRDGLWQRLEESEQKLRSLCEKASVIRERYAKKLSQEMTQALLELNFLTVQFEIQVRRKEQYSILGYDEAEFMISTNPGEPLKPLSEVASGGELSRIMLALKTVLADKDSIPSLIFDEIDAGISGKTAWKVSEKLAKLSCNHQVICITHLPQIAAMADSHYVITKHSLEGITQTCIKEIKDEDVIEELARLLGGEQITQAALGNAAELKKMATDNKNKFK